MLAVGTALGPCMHYWYQWLDRLYPGRAMNVVTKKVLIDQLIASPMIWFGFFIGEGNFLLPSSLSFLFVHTSVRWHSVAITHACFHAHKTDTKVTF